MFDAHHWGIVSLNSPMPTVALGLNAPNAAHLLEAKSIRWTAFGGAKKFCGSYFSRLSVSPLKNPGLLIRM